MRVRDKAALVAVDNVGADCNSPLILAPQDDAGAVHDADIGQLRKRHLPSLRCPNQHLPQPSGVASPLGRVSDGDVKAPVVLKNRADCRASHRGFDHVVHVLDVQSVTRDARPVDLNAKAGLVGFLLDGAVGSSRNGAYHAQRLIGQTAQFREVRAADDHGEIGRGSGHRFRNRIDDRLSEVQQDSRNLLIQLAAKIGDQVLFGAAQRPCRVRFECDQELVPVGTERIRARFITAGLGAHHKNLRVTLDQRAHLAGHLRGLLERCSRWKVCPDPDHSLVEIRQEFGAQPRAKKQRSADDSNGGPGHSARTSQQQPQQPFIPLSEP